MEKVVILTRQGESNMAATICVIVALAVVLYHNRKLFDQLGGDKKQGLLSPPILITSGLIIFNLVSRSMISWWWQILAHTWYTWLFFNVGFWSVLYFRTIKIKDKDGKDTEKAEPTASKLATIISILLVVGLLTTAFYKAQRGGLSEAEYDKKVVAEKALAKEPVLVAIAKCRPEDEFDTPDKIQIAKAKYQVGGVESWLKDSKCWVNHIPRGTTFTLAVVEAKQEVWSRTVYPLSIERYEVHYDCPPTEEYQVKLNGDEKLILAKGERSTITGYSLNFRAVRSKVATMTMIMRPAGTS